MLLHAQLVEVRNAALVVDATADGSHGDMKMAPRAAAIDTSGNSFALRADQDLAVEDWHRRRLRTTNPGGELNPDSAAGQQGEREFTPHGMMRELHSTVPPEPFSRSATEEEQRSLRSMHVRNQRERGQGLRQGGALRGDEWLAMEDAPPSIALVGNRRGSYEGWGDSIGPTITIPDAVEDRGERKVDDAVGPSIAIPAKTFLCTVGNDNSNSQMRTSYFVRNRQQVAELLHSFVADDTDYENMFRS